MPSVQDRILLTIAEGGIDPATRVAQGEITEAMVDDFADRLQTDDFFDEINPWLVPNVCVDGRGLAFGPNAAGGTLSLVIGDALTNQSYLQSGETAPQHALRFYTALKQTGPDVKIGAHDADHAHGEDCGCGAADKLDVILGYISRRGDDIREVMERLGVSVSDELHATIMSKAAGLTDQGYATCGADLRQACAEVEGEAAVETVIGQHNEAVLVINSRSGQTINRQKIRAAYGDKIQAFELDLANLQNGSELLALDEVESQGKYIAALYYNVATAAVLAGPSLRVVVR